MESFSFSSKYFYLTGKVWAVENLPQNIVGNGTFTVASAIKCAKLCEQYLYCQSFSYNEFTMECRFVVCMVAAQNASALSVTLNYLYVQE